ncbi:dihydroxyacetone kinase phosphoryl donor subunit DhaM [Cellulomonas sp. P22]|uniref:dihydroxyacetone kinase phosphoryl donor subunit DhaM n=1 Tax=Cellulomonas sp. P22 TaxID=3373189 RepID=UPI0037BCB505
MTAGVGGGARVALVLVSHSNLLAQGAVELAAQMAPGVELLAAGGAPAGGLGTSFEAIEQALEQATSEGRSAVVLTDLGSAVLTTESVLEMLDTDVAERVRLADAPFVEGAVAAAVEAHGGADLAAVLAAAERAASTFAGAPAVPAGAAGGAAGSQAAADQGLEAVVTLRNPLGLHARPAAVLARLVAGLDADVTIDGVNAASVLELMKLGATGGQTLTVRASGAAAREALDAVVAQVEGGFGEV